MNWKRTRLSINRWETSGYRITETIELDGKPFTLESINEEREPITFTNLKDAQAHAVMFNEIFLVKEENRHLREQLNLKQQADAFERSVKPDDGRGIPTSPTVEEIAIELNAVMAKHAAKEEDDRCACLPTTDIATGPRLAYAGEQDIPF